MWRRPSCQTLLILHLEYITYCSSRRPRLIKNPYNSIRYNSQKISVERKDLNPCWKSEEALLHQGSWKTLWEIRVYNKLIDITHIENLTANLPKDLLSKVKACVAIFWQIFIFPTNDSPLKTMKNVFYFI